MLLFDWVGFSWHRTLNAQQSLSRMLWKMNTSGKWLLWSPLSPLRNTIQKNTRPEFKVPKSVLSKWGGKFKARLLLYELTENCEADVQVYHQRGELMSDTAQIFHKEVESQAQLHKSGPGGFKVLFDGAPEGRESGCRTASLLTTQFLVFSWKLKSLPLLSPNHFWGVWGPFWLVLSAHSESHSACFLCVVFLILTQCSLIRWKQQMIVSPRPSFRTTVIHQNPRWLVIPGTSAPTVNHYLYIMCV